MAPIFTPPLSRIKTLTPTQKEQRKIQSERNVDEQEQGQTNSHEENAADNTPLFPTSPLSSHAATAAEKALLANLAPNSFSAGAKSSTAAPSSRKRRHPSTNIPTDSPSSQKVTSASHHPITLRSQHLSNLTTILHRSLLEGNYARADRAWSLLLRSESGGRAFDVRRHGRWGIGAEVLLWRYGERVPTSKREGLNRGRRGSGSESGSESNEERDSHADDYAGIDADGEQRYELRWSEESFRKAREYYEQLILHYPPSKVHPNSIDAGTFYPAMFNLWVYEVDQYGKRARTKIKMQSAGRPEAPSESIDDGTPEPQDQDRDAHDHSVGLERIRREQLRRAKEVLDRLTEVTSSPPHDQNAELLELRGHVELWVGDLHVSVQTSAAAARQPMNDDTVATEELYEGRRQKAYHTQRAKQAFRAAIRNGGRIWEGAARLLDGDDDYEGD